MAELTPELIPAPPAGKTLIMKCTRAMPNHNGKGSNDFAEFIGVEDSSLGVRESMIINSFNPHGFVYGEVYEITITKR